MQLWQDGVMVFLAAVGLASMIWTVARLVLFSAPERRWELAALLPARGGGEELEEQLRALQGLRETQGVFGRTLLVDCGLNEDGKKLAGILARKYRWVTLCGIDEIGRYLPG